MIHIPVLQKEVIECLDPKPGENFIDCTAGALGHAKAILEKNKPGGKVLGLEIDEKSYEESKRLLPEKENRLILVNDSYAKLKEIVERYNFRDVSGILFDLGTSSWHLDESGRGFTFRKDEPLDMRFDIKSELTAERIVNEYREDELENIIRNYGEEKFSRRIAHSIAIQRKSRPIKSTFELVEAIRKAVPRFYERGRIHPATRTFQALRIAANDELNKLSETLSRTVGVLKTGGRLAVISFHSLEDRIVKIFLRDSNKNNLLKILTKKPIRPSQEEINNNPRSRSAKLRAAIKI